MNLLHAGVLVAILVCAPRAQIVTASFAAGTPLVASVTVGGVPIQSSVPAGPLSSSGSVTAWHPMATSAIAWGVSGVVGGTQTATLRHGLDAQYTTPASLAATSEFVVTFAATSSAPASLLVQGSWGGTAGAALPMLSIDVGNDGTFEIVDLLAVVTTWTSQLPPLGPGGVAVRVVLSSWFVGSLGGASASADVSVVPVNNIAFHQTAVPCAGQMFPPLPAFENLGVDILALPWVFPMGGSLVVFVVGLSQQPVLLPPSLGLTCVLIPTPDIVLWQPSGWLHVPLPAAVRPLTFDVQGVVVTPLGLGVTEGYRITAN